MSRFEYPPMAHEEVGLSQVTEVELAQPDVFSREFAASGFVHLPDLINPDQAGILLTATTDVPSTRVICGDERISWDSQSFAEDHPVYQFFLKSDVTQMVDSITGLSGRRGLMAWTSRYAAWEYINPHRDVAGLVHLLICLESPPSNRNGGSLFVESQELFLKPGDAIVFDAQMLEHYTSPLIPTEEIPNPRRTVLVGRYL